MAEYELTPQVRAVLVSILRRAARRGRELREQGTAVSEAGNKLAVGDASVSERNGLALLLPSPVESS
jgi:hypothetical protein